MSGGAWRFELQRFAEGERTLPATPRRRQKARQEGRVAHSGDLTSAAVLLAATVALRLSGAGAATAVSDWATGVWGQLPSTGLNVQNTMATMEAGGRAGIGLLAPVLGAAALAAVAVGLAQTGLALQPGGLTPDFRRINPVQGLQRIFSRKAMVELGKAALRIGGLVAVLWSPMHALLVELVNGNPSAAVAVRLTYQAVLGGFLRVGIVLAIVGVGDYFYQRYEMDTQLRMTRQEVREEVKEQEGDPQLRGQRRRRMRELSRRRMLSDVRKSDVVIANPTHFAVALRYDAERMAAPVVVAKGRDFMAERIKAVARGAGVMVVENPPLARSLHAAIKVGQAVPEALYRAVAEVLAYVWRAQGRA